MSKSSSSKSPWWQLDPGGDVPNDWGLTCETCRHVLCTCSLYKPGDLAQRTDEIDWSGTGQ